VTRSRSWPSNTAGERSISEKPFAASAPPEPLKATPPQGGWPPGAACGARRFSRVGTSYPDRVLE